MKLHKLIVFLFFFHQIGVYSQEITIPSLSEKIVLAKIFTDFQTQHQFSFAYDVTAIKNISLSIKKEVISIETLQQIIELQTSYLLEKVDQTNFILVKNSKEINICGVVIDASSKFELPQTEILLGKRIIDITDDKGAFEIQLHPSDSIIISYLGYQNKTFKASDFSQKSCDTIHLLPVIEALEQVLVREYLTGGISKNQDASVNISTKKLRILPGLAEPDVLQSLQLLPGISSPTEDPAGLYIRGGTPGQNLVLWDGIKMYQSGHFFNQISTFNPFITKNVQIYRGGTSVRYGDRISGVIIIESDDDLLDEIKGGGGLNLTHGDLFLKIPLSKKLGIMIAGRRSTTDIYQNITYNNLVRKVFQNTRADIPTSISERSLDKQKREDDFVFLDANFKTVWKPNKKHTIKFSSIFAENRLDNERNGVVSLSRNTASNFKDILKNRNIGFSFNWDTKYTSTKQNINFYYSFYDQRYRILKIQPDTNQDSYINNGVKDIGGEYSLNVPLTDKQSLLVGYQFSYNEASVEQKIDFDPDILFGFGTNHTLYTDYKYKTEKTFLNLGLRASQLSNVNTFFIEPRIFVSKELFDNFTLNSSVELKNQQLNNYISNNYIPDSFPVLPVSNNGWILSTSSFSREGFDGPEIRVVKSTQLTLGSLYTYKGWNFDLEVYYKKITDFLPVDDLAINIATPIDFETNFYYGSEKRIGFDFLIKRRIQNYRFWVGYSLSKNKTKFPQIQDSYYPSDYDQTHVINFSQTLKHHNFEFALGWNYATGRPYTKIFPDSDAFYDATIDPKGINSSRFKSYHRLDTSVVYNFESNTEKKWNGYIGFSLRNLYNRENIISQGYREVTDENFSTTIESFQNQSLRITPDLVIRFKF